MYIRGAGANIEVLAPAKVNLFLEVLSKRKDGFHDILTFITAIGIFDTLSFVVESSGEISLACKWASGLRGQDVSESQQQREGALGDLPEETDNIVMRAVRLVQRRAGIRSGARVQLVKRIPAAAGLGGASSDAAAALVAANLAWRLDWPRDRLVALAAELGSDVPFFLGPGMAVCRGRGEQVEPVRAGRHLHLVVVRPPAGLSTREVYERCQPAAHPVSLQPFLQAWQSGNAAAVGRSLVNRLQATAETISPWVGTLRREFGRLDCLGHQMSGSGTSYFGICRHARHALRVTTYLRARGLGRVWYAPTVRAADCSR